VHEADAVRTTTRRDPSPAAARVSAGPPAAADLAWASSSRALQASASRRSAKAVATAPPAWASASRAAAAAPAASIHPSPAPLGGSIGTGGVARRGKADGSSWRCDRATTTTRWTVP
jgi:hypothetical protein